MSVLIKDMEMPECCAECWFKICGRTSATDENLYWYKHIYNCRCKPEEIEDGWIDAPEALNGKQPWCPLVEVPTPHGRLIDADAFEKENSYFWERDFINPKYEDTLADLVNAAPTIIEAED